MRSTMVLALVLLSSAIPAFAKDDPGTHQAKVAIEIFKKDFASDSMSRRMQALWDLAQNEHPLVVHEICVTVLGDEDPEVRAAGAQILGKVGADPDLVGRFLSRRLPKEDDYPEVQVALIRAIAKIGYTRAREALTDAAMRFLEEDYKFVTGEVCTAFGTLKDVKALPFLLKLAEFGLETVRGRRGPAIKTGSSPTNWERRNAWMRKYGKHAFPKGGGGFFEKWWLQELRNAVKAITGEEFQNETEFRTWLEEHAKELGLKTRDLDPKRKLKPKPPKNPPEPEEED